MNKINNLPERSEEEYIDEYIKNQEERFANMPKTTLSPKQIKGYKEIKFDFNDVLITPKEQSDLKSRYSDINPYYSNPAIGTHLPIFTAPMDSVVNMKNAHIFQKNKIAVVLPRTENKNILYATFTSYGLKDKPVFTEHMKFVLLDVANGHMSQVLEWCTNIKKRFPHVSIMAGNIANPSTYKLYCSSGVIDYARIGIGNGNGCLTTQQTGVGYPMGSLINECYEIKQQVKQPVKIVADGGMKDYSDIIKALALGADYVMVGSIFSKALESCAPTYWHRIPVNQFIASYLNFFGEKLTKEFRGMSTKEAQKALGNDTLKTSEGVVREYEVEYTLSQWVENFDSYLRSAMSYSNANTLENFIGKAEFNLISQNAFNRFNK
jgi:GMP reductase